MPQLETFVIGFLFAVPNREVERQLAHTPVITPVTLSNLRHFRSQGVPTYLKENSHRINDPRLEKLEIYFFSQLAFSVPSPAVCGHSRESQVLGRQTRVF